MTRDSIAAIVHAMVAETFELPATSVTSLTSSEDVAAWDSLQHTILLIRLQNRFDIQFPPRRSPSTRQVGALVDALCAACGT